METHKREITMFAYLVSALPVFWMGYLMIYIFMHKFGLFPIAFGFSRSKKLSWLYFLLLVFVLGIGNGTMSEIVRYLREEIGRVFPEDYIRTALSKGTSILEYVLRRIKENSISSLNDALDMDPGNPLALARLGRLRLNQNESENPYGKNQADALTALAVRLAPDNAEVLYLRGEVLQHIGRPE